MRLGGFVPLSLVDYPERLAATVFTAGCNFRCPFCHNPELVLPERMSAPGLDAADLLGRIEARRRFLDGVVVTGGEPTVQEDLPEFLRELRALDVLIKLDTNGARPDVLEQVLSEDLADYVAMDVKGPQERYAEFAGVPVRIESVVRSVAAIRAAGVAYEFRTTVVPGIRREDLNLIAAWLHGAAAYYLQPFRVPSEKGLVDPAWAGRPSLAAEELRTIWRELATGFERGGVRD